MAKLTTSSRNKLKSSSFALPGRRYPIHDRAHAANAKARASGKPEEKAVNAAVAKKFPGLGKKNGGKGGSGAKSKK